MLLFAEYPHRKLSFAIITITLFLVMALLVKLVFFPDIEFVDTPVSAQPVFVGTKPPPFAQKSAELEKTSVLPPEVELTGIVYGANGQRLAIVSVNKTPELIVRIGDLIFAASTVTEINLNSLTYRHGSNLIRVVMQSRSPPSQGNVASETQIRSAQEVPDKDNTLPGFVKGTGPIRQQSPSDVENGNAEFRQAFEQKMKSFQLPP